MAEPDWSLCAPGSATVTMLVTVHESEAVSLAPEPSDAVTVTDDVPAVVGVPLMTPDEGSIARPSGRPVAEYVRVAVDDESVPTTSTGVMAEPDRSDWSPGLVTETVLVTVHENEAVSLAPEPSDAVTVTDDVPAVVGVPLMTPDEGSMARPSGRPVADQVRVAVDDESVPTTSTGVMAEPDRSDWSPGLVTETALVTVHENEAVPAKPESSVAVTVTDDVPAVVGEPLMVPVAGSMARPSGRPVADQVRVALDDESVADSSTGVMAEPDWSDWSPGLVTETVSVTVQENEAVPAKPESSVAVTVTDDVPAVVGVPLMTPDEGSMARPAGRPVAEYARVAVDDESVATTSTGVMAEPVTEV